MVDANFEPISSHTVEVVNDELVMVDLEGNLFEYNYLNKDSQRIQETLFLEKQTIIENCLFGVDINPNSVKICRLRLWIELLKNAYYKQDLSGFENLTGLKALETLPNIDINIKCGNSLVSRFAIDSDLSEALRKSKYSIDSYRLAVMTYRNAQSKEEKREMERLIAEIKSDFRSEIAKNDPKIKRKAKLGGELYNLTMQTGLFEISAKEKKDRKKKIEKIEEELEKLTIEIEEIKNNKIYENAFEWRFEFPEVLNETGDFVGFDVVIGNPPYIRQEEFSEFKHYLLAIFQETGTGTADLFVYFVELAFKLLKSKGEFTYIIPNKWMRAGYGKKLREFVANQEIHQLIDFGDSPVFEEATTYPCIIQLRKNRAELVFKACIVDSLQFEDGLDNYIEDNNILVNVTELSSEGWTLSDTNVQVLLSKLRSKGKPLGEYVNGKIFYGIKTALNEAFIINSETKNRLIAEDARSADVIKPFLAGRDIKRYQTPKADKFLILFPKGFTIKRNLPKGNANYIASEPPPRYGDMPYDNAWEWIKSNYPAITKHLWPFKAKAEKRTDKGDYWWELRACDYYGEFEKNKIVWAETSFENQFCIVEGGVYLNKTSFMIPSDDLILLGILNSSLARFFFSSIVSKVRGGYFSMSKAYVETFSICYPTDNKISLLAQSIIETKKQDPTANTNDLENQIDQLVYELYGLTDDEIKIIEGYGE
ncbi:type II restriction/modification system DNA methylase subunit YeeA [Cecembia calidifontis]|uniref:site-specific DNA-methyltransferase (adenine-specific) n=2 Tax=Cecembia calidifontis TaxID=1187080 RepID=A0A4Q7PC59_9BACT|nr:type II restriction/modification system DNA methylase subunit YeeA [Cecembia calidifontis]